MSQLKFSLKIETTFRLGLRPWLRPCDHAVCPLWWWSSWTKDMQSEQILCWSGMTDAEHKVQHLVQTK